MSAEVPLYPGTLLGYKNDTFERFVGKWRYLGNIPLTEIDQAHRLKHRAVPLIK